MPIDYELVMKTMIVTLLHFNKPGIHLVLDTGTGSYTFNCTISMVRFS